MVESSESPTHKQLMNEMWAKQRAIANMDLNRPDHATFHQLPTSFRNLTVVQCRDLLRAASSVQQVNFEESTHKDRVPLQWLFLAACLAKPVLGVDMPYGPTTTVGELISGNKAVLSLWLEKTPHALKVHIDQVTEVELLR